MDEDDVDDEDDDDAGDDDDDDSALSSFALSFSRLLPPASFALETWQDDG